MLHHKKIYSLLAVLFIIFLVSCYKNSTVFSETGDEITRPVSFATDLIPIFNSSCNISGCHNTGGRVPDLSVANAYTSLSNGGYINTSDPQSSLLYLWMTGKMGTPMPVGGINRDYNALVLAWLKQGASNN